MGFGYRLYPSYRAWKLLGAGKMLLTIIIGIAVLAIALNGWLYQPKKNPDDALSWNNLNKIGKTLLFLIILANTASIAKTIIDINQKEKAGKDSELLLKERDAKIASLITTQAENQERLKLATAKIEAFQEIVTIIRDQSERQPQIVMAQYVTIGPRQIWRAPNKIFSGSIIEFYGWEEDIELHYGDSSQNVPRTPYMGEPKKIAIIGNSGDDVSWSIKNLSAHEVHGKVFVTSTPRLRSFDWSWVEERARRYSVQFQVKFC
jgi:hypothetical protein